MTLVVDRSSIPPLAEAPASKDISSSYAVDRKYFTLTAFILLTLYLLLQNPYWVPSGDGEFYVSAARSIALGQGYRFNGLPIGSAPPGWAAIMAVVMKITPYFLPLKLLTMTCMIASLLLGFRVVRRFLPPPHACAVIVMTGLLSHVYQATYWLISESAFCLATTTSILVAMQIAEGRRQKWRVMLLLALCAAATSIRLAGLLNAAVIVAVLIDGEWKPRRASNWIAAILVIIVTTATFTGWRLALRVTNEQMAEITGLPYGTAQEIPTPDLAPMINGAADQTAHRYQLFPRGSYGDRFLNWGHWFSYLYWQPLRAAGSSPKVAILSALLGWTLVALLMVMIIVSLRRRRWLWAGVAVYTGALAMGWNVINSRYYVPIAFLITVGVVLAAQQLLLWSAASAHARIWRGAIATLFITFVGTVVLTNLATYAIEVRIARSADFYQRYEAGLNETIIAACQYLNALPPGERPRDGEIAVSQRYTNLGRSRSLPSSMRIAILLTGRAFITPRFKDTTVSPDVQTAKGAAIRKWLQAHGARYYLWQPPISPWRVWHFRMGWLEKARTGRTSEVDAAGWQLWRLESDMSVTRLPVPPRCEPVTRVPML
jgi:hypothetical protein